MKVEGDCSSYYVCNNGEYQINQCPAGLHWNQVTLENRRARQVMI